VRRSSLVLALLTACTEPNTDKPKAGAAEAEKAPTAAEPELDTGGEPELETPSNRPIKSIGELMDEVEAAEAKCVATCVEANLAAAKPADVIEADCRAKCEQHPTEQPK
jgi:hypothetical protein